MTDASSSSSLRTPPTGGVRFAPSPTGRFHVGNLRTAWISRLWADALARPWVVRFEDIDTARVLAGAQAQQLEDMAALDLKPDLVLVQSSFHERHLELFERGVLSGALYPCDCSRKDVQTALAGLASAPHDGQPPVYSGHCRALSKRELGSGSADSIAWRFRMAGGDGKADFIVARSAPRLDAGGLPDPRSFTPAYHWACAVDDFDGRYDLLVRGSDLRTAEPLQKALQRWIGSVEGGSSTPPVFHTSLVVQNDGHRLEKRTKGVTLPELEGRGIRPERLLGIFEKSFDRSLLARVEQPASELREILKLEDLGL